jgi:4-hydroxy-tetrahydrodipicolinate synthase
VSAGRTKKATTTVRAIRCHAKAMSASATEPLFRGVAVALVTLFDADLEVDVQATAAHAARLVELGITGVLVAGTTGEAAALTDDERNRLIGAVRQALPPAVPVIAGTGAGWGREAAARTVQAADAGAAAALVLSPPLATDPRPYYDEVAKASAGMPLLAYHYPAVSGPGIAVEYLDDLPVVAVKDSSGDAERLLAEVETSSLPVYTGSSALVGMAGLLGCPGAILALANAEPEGCVAAFEQGSQGLIGAAHLAQRAHGGFPHAIKRLTAARFGTPAHRRMG